MRLILLTCLTMIAFAANSVLNRLALVDAGMGPAAFAAIRLASGAVVLMALVWLRGGGVRPVLRPRLKDAIGPLSLALYVLGFSFAYVSLPAGVGALLLLGGVQVTMFVGAIILREEVPLQRWLGAGLAFSGLVWLLWPGAGAMLSLAGGVLMAAAALGWGIYSLLGRSAVDALGSTAMNFLLAMPLAMLVFVILPDRITAWGAVLAVFLGRCDLGVGLCAVVPDITATGRNAGGCGAVERAGDCDGGWHHISG